VKHVVPRELANRDVEEAIDHCLAQANAEVALGFVDELSLDPAVPARQLPADPVVARVRWVLARSPDG
jgi:hypothetical protein